MNINDLRDLLLNVITEVKDGSLEIDKAKTICAVSNSVINLTRIEMMYNGDNVGIEFMNYIQDEEDVSESLREIEERNKQPYKIETSV